MKEMSKTYFKLLAAEESDNSNTKSIQSISKDQKKELDVRIL